MADLIFLFISNLNERFCYACIHTIMKGERCWNANWPQRPWLEHLSSNGQKSEASWSNPLFKRLFLYTRDAILLNLNTYFIKSMNASCLPNFPILPTDIVNSPHVFYEWRNIYANVLLSRLSLFSWNRVHITSIYASSNTHLGEAF